jgi:hypothetical protein
MCMTSSYFSFSLFNQKKKKRSVCACCPTSVRKVEWGGLISSFFSSRDRPFWRDVLDSACKTVCIYLFLLIHFRCVWLHPISPSSYSIKKKKMVTYHNHGLTVGIIYIQLLQTIMENGALPFTSIKLFLVS